jgi:hypothetical protein
MLGTSAGWRWSLVLVPVLLTTPWLEVVFSPLSSDAASLVRTSPWALVGLLGAGWEPLAMLLRWLQGRTVTSLVAVNGLNLADALLTAFALHHAEAVETNPVIRAVGLPAKIVAVGLLSALVARRSPRALVWPALALLAVLAWHLGGLYLNAHV